MKKQHNGRRAFMKQGTVLAAATLASPLLSSANFFSGANDDIKVALIGCGGRGTGAAFQALMARQNVKLVAMADAFADRLDNCYKA
nr:dehydrogenase [Chitinophagaceae bacterium]